MSDSDPEIGNFVVANGIKTNFLEAGRGEAVLLVHGSGPGVTAYANWRLVIPKLSRHFRVIAPDIVGFGYTDRPADAAYDLDYWVDHLIGLIEALDLRSIHIVGNSFGGALALAVTLRRPQLVNRLVLMGSVGVEFELTPGLDAVWGYQPSVENMGKLLDLFAYDKSRITPDLIQSRYKASVRPGYQESFAKMFPAPRQQGVAALTLPEEELRRVSKRVLLIHGRDDQVIPLANSVKLHSLIADSQLHAFGRCGHWVQIERNEEFCALVGEFLGRQV